MLKKILVISSSNDITCSYIVKNYSNFAEFFRLDTDVLENYKISIQDSVFTIKNSQTGESVCLKDIYAIYYRKPTFPERIKNYSRKYRKFMQQEFKKFLFGLVTSFEGKIITDPYILQKADNKILQMKIAEKVGFRLPKTIITNEPELVLSTLRNSKKKWIIKPLSTGNLSENTVVYTNTIESFPCDSELESLKFSPHIFQELINKNYDLRITAVNDNFFAVKILSSNIDWRAGECNYKEITIPDHVKSKCYHYMKEFNLNFCAFDLVFSEGKYYFLEGNPNGQWLWLELEVNLPISYAIVKALTE